MAESPIPVGFKRDGTPQKHSNQWLKNRELGRDLGEKDKDRHRAECVAAMLEQHAYGKRKMSNTQVQAAKALISVGKPALQAVETSSIEPAMVLSEADILNQIKAALAQYPHLINRAQAELAKEQANPVSDLPQPKVDAA